MKLKNYLSNCFLLLIPILLWNILLTPYLPEAFGAGVFWKNIPNWIAYPENSFRIAVMILPTFMILSLKTRPQRLGLGIYLVGMLLYFLSWTVLITYPNSKWSQSIFGFTAPAYTPVLWLIGIGLIGTRSFFKSRHLGPIYMALSLLFIVFHVGHTYLVYQRL